MIPTPSSLSARRVLVLAPHPDDESLGCGGLLASFSADGRRARVVFVTDGGASHPGSSLWSRERLSAQRRSEALSALGILGLAAADAEFLGLRDADMPAADTDARDDALARLADVVSTFQPDMVVLPWRRDPHRDHRDVWRLGMDALSRTGGEPPTLEFAVWLEEIGEPEDFPENGEMKRVVFDVTAVLDRKRAAIAAHRTQTTDLIADDPTGFRLTPETIDRLAGPTESYWHPCR